MNKSKIEWTDRTWNPVTGCTKVSQGCKNCYAERLYERFNGPHSFKNVLTHPERLSQPQKWKQPSKFFVNSMSDLFHEDVPFAFIHDVFDVMAANQQHVFQVLTKRPARMLEFLEYYSFNIEQFNGRLIAENIWIGVSVEDQATADERIPLLLSVPASVRFLSCEPLLGAINLKYYPSGVPSEWLFEINWLICGGESGPGARPMHPDWARSLRDQCEAAGVPFFFKQWGEYKYGRVKEDGKKKTILVNNVTGKITSYSNWDDLVPDIGTNAVMVKVGKKAAGNLLDGRTHLAFPTEKTVSK